MIIIGYPMNNYHDKLKGECKLNHMKMIRGKAFMEGRAPSCEANAINATGCNSINS